MHAAIRPIIFAALFVSPRYERFLDSFLERLPFDCFLFFRCDDFDFLGMFVYM